MAAGRSTNNFDKKIGERMRARRLHIGMSQQDLADALGISFQQIQKYEKGVNRVAASRLADIATALGMHACDFFAGLTPGEKKSGASSETAELAAMYERIPTKKARRQVLDLVRTLAGSD